MTAALKTMTVSYIETFLTLLNSFHEKADPCQ